MLNVIILRAIKLSVIMLSVIMRSLIMLNVLAPLLKRSGACVIKLITAVIYLDPMVKP
jgi:hypothetical protein